MKNLVLFMVVSGILFGVMGMFLRGMERDIFNDDAYYYMVTAKNFAETGFITFDGETRASGFHPLFWMIQVSAFRSGGDLSPPAMYRAVNIIIAFLLTIPLFILGFLTRREKIFGLVLMTSALICLIPDNIAVFYNGMESALTLPLFCFFIYFLYRKRYLWAGFAGMLLTASRLDAFLYIIIPVFIVYFLTGDREISVIAPSLAFLLVYCSFNYMYYGHFMPVSGILKSSFPLINLQWHNLFKNYMPVAGIILSLSGIILAGRKSRLVTAVGIASLSQVMAILLFQKWAKPVSVWYLGLLFIAGMICFFIGLSVKKGERFFTRLMVLIICIIFLYNTAFCIRRIINYRGQSDPGNSELVEFIRDRQGLWAYTDCGALSFWSGAGFVNLDGLMNDMEYQECIARGELGMYLKKRGVDYIIAGIWSNQQDNRGVMKEPVYRYRVNKDAFRGDYEYLGFYAYSYKYGKFSEELRLYREREVCRTGSFIDGNAYAKYIVYDMR